MKNGKPVHTGKTSAGIITWDIMCSRMSIIMFVMMAGNCGTSGRKRKNRMAIHRLLRSVTVKTAAAADIEPDASINIILKKMRIKANS